MPAVVFGGENQPHIQVVKLTLGLAPGVPNPSGKLALALFEEDLHPVRPAISKNEVVVHVVTDIVFWAGVFGIGHEVFQFLPIPLNGSFPVLFFA